MKIGLLSDTHSTLDPKIFKHFADVDEVWHAGDLGHMDVVHGLESFKPLRAVFGNIDDAAIRRRFPEDLVFTCEGFQIWITHIGGIPPKYNPRVLAMLKKNAPDIFICGHSHILRVKRDEFHNNLLYINPGAAGNHGFHKIKTLVRFELVDRKIMNMEVVEIGNRGVIQ